MTPLDDILSTGDRIDAKIHRRLIMSLFFKNSPLHDGALVISGGKIVAGEHIFSHRICLMKKETPAHQYDVMRFLN